LHSEDIREAMTPHDTKKMSGNEIREMFLRFFESKGHRRVRSSSLVPHGDPTLLFTNAGMNQFKDVFLGLEKRDYNKATTAQKCVRAGGKHNDLENVGFTKRHHTFFEMMGNFSFGDYFKEKAIPYAWELVTSPEWFGIAKEKLYVTVFGGADLSPSGHPERSEGPGLAHNSESTSRSGGMILGVDEEAREIWLKEKIPAERIVPIPGLKDNFWAMGDTGPCGPCSEIFYDMGPEASEEGHVGDKECKFPCDCGRYVEIWNLVFMQFNRDTTGTLTPLPKPSIDTGMGLERTAAVLQGVISNYDTDLFVPLLKRAAELCGVDFQREEKLEEGKGGAASLRVIADHARAATFLIADGVLPSNDGRGYVLRKIIRRGLRHGTLLGAKEPFLYEMVDAVRQIMGVAYPEITQASAPQLKEVVKSEEQRFAHVLGLGEQKRKDIQLLVHLNWIGETVRSFSDRSFVGDEREFHKQLPYFLPEYTRQEAYEAAKALVGEKDAPALRDYVAKQFSKNPPTFPGDEAFKLYDTYGLPLDFIRDALRDDGLRLDEEGFERAMEEQRTKARASWKGGAGKEAVNPAFAKIAETFKTEKDFYQATTAKDARIEAIIGKSGPISELKPGESGEVVLDRTVIYAESGGQMADTGAFYDNSGAQLLAEVTGAYYPVAGLVAHRVNAKETLRVGDRVSVIADTERHARIIRNHSGTHLVHAALRNILGTHVKQAGSLNAPERLRFDFSHFAHVDAEELKDIEQQVNDEIRHNTEIGTEITSLDNALASGALAFFGDKYPEANVRVVTIPDERSPRGFYSKELCGGTHVHRIGDIGVLKIVSEGSVAAGVRRIEAVTGIGALEHYEKQAQILSHLTNRLNTSEDSVLATVEKLSSTVKQLEKELEGQKRKGALGQLDQLANQVQSVKGVKLIAAEVAGIDKETLRQLVDSLRQKLGSGVVVLSTADDGKVALIAGVTKDLTAKVHAGKLIQTLAKLVGGSGGGRPDLAEAGGKDTSALKSALSTIPAYLEPLL
jgi:alanyl-tRNA synthetase